MLPIEFKTTITRYIHKGVAELNDERDLSVLIASDSEIELNNIPLEGWTENGKEKFGAWRHVTFIEKGGDYKEHILLAKGDITTSNPLLIRIHSSFLPAEVFFSTASDDREQLTEAMRRIEERKRGIIIYVDQDGAGHGKAAAAAQLALTNQGIPVTEAFEQLGLTKENRSFQIAGDILKILEVTAHLKLMTNNVNKQAALHQEGFEVLPFDFQVEPTSDTAKQYLKAKQDEGIYNPKGGD